MASRAIASTLGCREPRSYALMTDRVMLARRASSAWERPLDARISVSNLLAEVDALTQKMLAYSLTIVNSINYRWSAITIGRE